MGKNKVMRMVDKNTLLIDEKYSPILIPQECEDLKPIMKEFMEAYAENKDSSIKEWMIPVLKRNLPEYDNKSLEAISDDIEKTLSVQEEYQESLQIAVEEGRSKESWFAGKVKENISRFSANQTVEYLNGLDVAVKEANEALYRTITVQSGGAISQNPNLDGFIAEQYHAQTFNLNAAAKGSQYRAKVLEPNGKGYAKNSVDLVIEDGSGHVVKRYQSKYCKDSKATENAFQKGDYRGQQKLVPEEQSTDMQVKSTSTIEAPDGTKSNPLTKTDAKEMQKEAQSGNWNELNWNEYKTKDLAIGIGKQAGYAAVQGAAIGVGFEVAQKVWNGEEIKGEDVIEAAIVSGVDHGAKAAVAGALKVGAEKGLISVIPKGTPAGTIANIAHVAVENVKVLGKMASGELTFREGVERMEQTTVGTVAGLAAMESGATIGATVGAVFGPVGAAVGGFIGGTVGYMAGSAVGEAVVKGAQKIRRAAGKILGTIGDGVKSVVSSVGSCISSLCSGIAGIFGF